MRKGNGGMTADDEHRVRVVIGTPEGGRVAFCSCGEIGESRPTTDGAAAALRATHAPIRGSAED